MPVLSLPDRLENVRALHPAASPSGKDEILDVDVRVTHRRNHITDELRRYYTYTDIVEYTILSICFICFLQRVPRLAIDRRLT
jgi:hypothetical protein